MPDAPSPVATDSRLAEDPRRVIERADRLRQARKAAGMTREAIAAALGCSASFVKKWEAGQAQLRVDQLARFAELTGSDIKFLALGLKTTEDVAWIERFDRRGEPLPCAKGVLPADQAGLLAGLVRGRGAAAMVVVRKNVTTGREERLAVARLSEELALGWLRCGPDQWEFRPERTPYWNRVSAADVVGEVVFLGERTGDLF
jgi:transcriptional regulator with XRE-family HTH domain